MEKLIAIDKRPGPRMDIPHPKRALSSLTHPQSALVALIFPRYALTLRPLIFVPFLFSITMKMSTLF